jgi:hypothetical protein
MAQKTEQNSKHDRRASEEQTWYARKQRERELVQSRELADGHHIRPRGHDTWQSSMRELSGVTSKLLWPVKVS